MTDDNAYRLAHMAVDYLAGLLDAPKMPEPPPELADMEDLRELSENIGKLREHLLLIADGDLSQDLMTRGFVAGLLKKHVANLRHLTWQVEQVSLGDFSQRVDFMGEFSVAFNNMVVQLDTTLKHLRETKEHLTKLTNSLKQEVELRSTAVQALEKSRARFQYLADHDPLTGALNRRSFLQIAESGIERARLRGRPCCIAMLDVDHFKKFNDSYGHISGDAALKHVVQVSTHALREKDCMGRYGGEEFIFFFDETGAETGFKVADRIREAIAGSPVEIDGRSLPLTASVGVAAILPQWEGARDGLFLQKVINMADVALYRAKQEGRNRVCASRLVHPDEFGEEAGDTVCAPK